VIGPDQLKQAYAAGLIDRPVKSILDVRRPMKYGEFVWNDRGVPPGPAWVRVDLHAQLMSVFRAGHEIGATVILYGADALPTPAQGLKRLARRCAPPQPVGQRRGLRGEGEAHRIDAIALPRRRRPVVEDMALVRAAARADDLGPHHAVARVVDGAEVLDVERL